jgi:hypothetical protein
MNTDINVHLNPDTFTALQHAALAAGRSLSEEAAAALEHQYGMTGPRRKLTEQEAQEARERFERHFGTVSFGSADNEQIDADLAREYGRTHDGD